MSDGLIKWSLNAKYDSLTHHAHILQADAAMAGQHGALQRMLEDFIIVKTFIVTVLGQVTSIWAVCKFLVPHMKNSYFYQNELKMGP